VQQEQLQEVEEVVQLMLLEQELVQLGQLLLAWRRLDQAGS